MTENTRNFLGAVTKGDIEKVKEYVKLGTDVNGTNDSGWTGLMFAVYFKNKEMVEFFLKQDIFIDLISADGKTVLDRAKVMKHTEIIEMIEEVSKQEKISKQTNSTIADSFSF